MDFLAAFVKHFAMRLPDSSKRRKYVESLFEISNGVYTLVAGCAYHFLHSHSPTLGPRNRPFRSISLPVDARLPKKSKIRRQFWTLASGRRSAVSVAAVREYSHGTVRCSCSHRRAALRGSRDTRLVKKREFVESLAVSPRLEKVRFEVCAEHLV